VRMNRKMKATLRVADPAEFSRGERLSEKLSQVLAQGFSVLDGAVVFTSLRKIAGSLDVKNFPDLTGFECFVNHIHVEDELDGPVDSRTRLLRQAIAFAVAVNNQLHSLFPGKAFRVIVAASGSGSGVRFHAVRPEEEWLASDLDGYEEEAVLVLES